jgi:hypothetical protein
MSNLWVLIKNGSVVKCLTSRTNEAGDWREAVEVPLNIPPRHIVDGHYFDTSKNPVEIIYKTKEVSLGDRKSSLMHKLVNKKMEDIQKELLKNTDLNCSEECCSDTILSCINFIKEQKIKVLSANTNE